MINIINEQKYFCQIKLGFLLIKDYYKKKDFIIDNKKNDKSKM